MLLLNGVHVLIYGRESILALVMAQIRWCVGRCSLLVMPRTAHEWVVRDDCSGDGCCGQDAGIQDINLTRPEIVNIFMYVQDDGAVLNAADTEEHTAGTATANALRGRAIIGGEPMPDDTEMDYGEFCEVGLACEGGVV